MKMFFGPLLVNSIAAAIICLFASQSNAAIEISVSSNDLGDRFVRQWDTSNSNAFSSWDTRDGAVSDIAIDPVTGDRYALTQGGIRRQTANNGVEFLGLFNAGFNQGGDIEVFNGLISVSSNDLGDRFVRQWDTKNSNAFSIWDTRDGAVNDISIDPVTGDLYALTQSGIRRQTVNNGVQVLGLANAGFNQGADLEVYDGVISASLTDLGDRFVRQWDTNNSNAFSFWDPRGGAVSDIAIDPVTGELYALTQSGIRRQTANNGVEILGLFSAGFNLGGDIEIFSLPTPPDPANVPEPTSLLVWGLLGMACSLKRSVKEAS